MSKMMVELLMKGRSGKHNVYAGRLVLFICMLAVLNLFFVNTASAASDVSDTEISKAIEVSLITEDLAASEKMDDVITYATYCQMVRRVINDKAPGKLKDWNEIAADAISSDKEMTRGDAIITLYEAAVILGMGDVAIRFLYLAPCGTLVRCVAAAIDCRFYRLTAACRCRPGCRRPRTARGR